VSVAVDDLQHAGQAAYGRGRALDVTAASTIFAAAVCASRFATSMVMSALSR